MSIYTDSDNFTDSDSEYSSYSSYSTDSVGSIDSSNSSNYTIGIDLSNYYKGDIHQKFIKQFQQQQMKQFQQQQMKQMKQFQQQQMKQLTQLTQMLLLQKQHDNSLRKIQSQNHLEMHRNKMRYQRDIDEENNSHDNTIKTNIGFNSIFDKNTPLIDYLIKKRTSYGNMGSSSHIAAFIPVIHNSRYCFIREWKGKDHCG